MVLGFVLAAPVGCTSTSSTPTTPPEPACQALGEVVLAPAANTARTPVPIPPSDEAVQAAMVFKDVARDYARDPEDPWAISHALIAIGADMELENGENAVDWLFAHYAETFEVCGETLVHFPRKRGETRIEPHTDLILKALTEVGVSPDREVIVQGKKVKVEALYRGSLYRAWVASSSGAAPKAILDTVPYGPPVAAAAAGPDGTVPPVFDAVEGHGTENWNDVPWALAGLAAWSPQDVAWTAEGGREMTLDRLTHATVLRVDAETQALQVQHDQGQSFNKADAAKAGGLVSMTCGGAHMLQGTQYAVARGFGESEDRDQVKKQIDLLFWRYQSELDTYTQLLETQPRYRTVLMMQRLKFLGHFLETTHRAAALGLFAPDQEQTVLMTDASVQLIATAFVLSQTGILKNLDKMLDPATPELYPGIITNKQLYLDYVGDSAHAYRGLDLALGHGVVRY